MNNRVRKAEPRREFNPNGNFNWQPEDEFVLNGLQFSLMFNVFFKLAMTGEHVPAKAIVDGYDALVELLKIGYEQGVVKEHNPAMREAPEKSGEVEVLDPVI